MHKRCSGISKKLRAEDEDEFKCRKCDNGGNLVHPEAKFVELDDGSKFECVDKFCYLGDMLLLVQEVVRRRQQKLESGQHGVSLMSWHQF